LFRSESVPGVGSGALDRLENGNMLPTASSTAAARI
jgi:hypothetical protein